MHIIYVSNDYFLLTTYSFLYLINIIIIYLCYWI
nr:MAG TPA: hypothetical protein [Bacteriophage sp.]